ncbi:MAG: Uncharacterized protein AWT59_2373 [Candidatus Gallionella acididurans]|uniref:Surface-adhesin protein E-like domain-containing protein n=1 Tax=Candidatus Gallionella acididurans TaxID=1796491 RepID=A0A139BR88_9PROT|nr:MAG: Uncharacterized protein AWT59_2373 [Candidatus Gallionella acididurans]
MIKATLMLLLAILSDSALAEWVRVGSIENGSQTIYANPSTIRKHSNTVKMWSLHDFNTPHSPPDESSTFLSYKQLDAYDCKNEQFRKLSFAFYSGNMGGESAVYTDSIPDKWQPFSPESVTEKLWQVACDKN